jgi:hypothetical protein
MQAGTAHLEGRLTLSHGQLCNLLHTQASNVLFLRSVAHALAGVDPLQPLAEGVTLVRCPNS